MRPTLPTRRLAAVGPHRAAACVLAALAAGDCRVPGEGDPCAGVACSEQGICLSLRGRPYCECTRGWHPVDLDCEPDDPEGPCRGVACDDHGTCRIASGAPVCDCWAGYHSYGPLHCIAGASPPDAAALDAVPTASGAIDDMRVLPEDVELGGGATAEIEVRSTGPGPLEDAVLVVDARSPSGASRQVLTDDIDLLPGASRTYSQVHEPLDEEGIWTFRATLRDAAGRVIDGGPPEGLEVDVWPACDHSCVCGWFKPLCAEHPADGSDDHWHWECYVNRCPVCGRDGTLQYFRSNELDGPPAEPPELVEHMVRCWTEAGGCDASYCGVDGRQTPDPPRGLLAPCARPCPPPEGP
jgi:hypothetical protein